MNFSQKLIQMHQKHHQSQNILKKHQKTKPSLVFKNLVKEQKETIPVWDNKSKLITLEHCLMVPNSILPEIEDSHYHLNLVQAMSLNVGIKASYSLPEDRKLFSIAHLTWLTVTEDLLQSFHQKLLLSLMLNLLISE